MIRSPLPQLVPATVEVFEPEYHRLAYPVDVQPKLDGWRCLAQWCGDEVVLVSRSGETMRIDHINAAMRTFLPRDAVLDGEVWAPGMGLDNIGSLIRRPCPSSALLKYAIFDMPVVGGCLDLPWRNRVHALRETCKGYPMPSCLMLVATTSCATSGDACDLFSHLTNMGHEGIVLRVPSARYGETGAVLKRKNFSDAEYPVLGVDRSKPLAVVTLTTPSGDITVTTSRAQAHGLRFGELVTVTYCGLTAKGLPREPRFKAVRHERDLPKGSP